MLITFPLEILQESNPDYQFLTGLNDRLHLPPVTYIMTPNMSGSSQEVTERPYNKGERVSSIEAERVIGLVNDRTGLVLTPVNTNFGLSVGFLVRCAGIDRQDILLDVLEEQMPKQFRFEGLSKIFMREDNIRRIQRLDDAGIKHNIEMPRNDYGHYDY